MATTTEQRIRNDADQVADWVVVVCGYSRESLETLAEVELCDGSLNARGAVGRRVSGLYTVACSATSADVL